MPGDQQAQLTQNGANAATASPAGDPPPPVLAAPADEATITSPAPVVPADSAAAASSPAPVDTVASEPAATAPAAAVAAPAPTDTAATLSPIAASLSQVLRSVDEQLLHPDEGQFVGRDFVSADIRQFLSLKNRMLVLVGPQGVGKTAIAAQLVRQHLGDTTAYLGYFCGLSGNDNPFVFCSALASLLAQQLGGYTLPETARQQQVNIQNSLNVGQASSGAKITGLTLNIGGMHPHEAFRQLVREPLRAYSQQHAAEGAHPPVVIVIDGLDRAWDWDGGQDGNIVSVLADAQDLPAWVNLICTARPGPAVGALRNQAGVRVIDLLSERGAENRKDIETFLQTCFLDRLPANLRDRFDLEIAGLDTGQAPGGLDHTRAFIQKAADASEGNFLFVRRYVDAWNAALQAPAGQPGNTSALLAFDKGTLSRMLDDTYASTLAQLKSSIPAGAEEASEAVLAALAIAFAPLDIAVLSCIAARDEGDVQFTLNHSLNAVIESRGEGDECVYTLYHRGFADYVRRSLGAAARRWDLDAASRLDRASDEDAGLRDYRARYRWSHLLRGLDLATNPDASAPAGEAATAKPAPAEANLTSASDLDSLDPIAHAQLLRALAAHALDPGSSDATLGQTAPAPATRGTAPAQTGAGSWAAALNSLKAATQVLRNSRALAYTRRRRWGAAVAGPASPELIELERTLVALGDAYVTIARRMDASGQRPGRPAGVFGALHLIWDLAVRLPLTIYLLLVLLLQGVREIHIPGALQNLGRAQDWTVARLCVLSVSAYRRARRMAHARGDDESAAMIHEHLAGVYTQMGAYDAAASSYEALLARPASIARPWRQAVWRLELGEVLVAQFKADQAVEVLGSALLAFEAQQAPIQRARALSALATAHHLRANLADARGDSQLATTLDQQAIESCDEALKAWAEVTPLGGDESASVDRQLAISNVAHQLWRAERNGRMGDEQRREARHLLDTIDERHFPQRFEHPVLRLFRISATILLPAYLLAGLLMAVQLPSTIQVQTQTGLEFPPPMVDPTRFPNEQISGNAASIDADEARTFSPVNLTKLANSNVQLQTSPPRLNPLGTTKVLLLIMGAYLALYTLSGLAVIAFSSPAQFQSRRPGRLILRKLPKPTLDWSGPAGQGSLMDAIEWVGQDARWAAARALDRLARLFRGSPKPPPERPRPAPRSSSLALSDIGEIIAIDRTAFGDLLHDFSFALIQPRSPDRAPSAAARRPMLIPGTILHYEELCDELEQRLNRPRRHFGVEFARSWSGAWFLVTLIYMLALLALLPLTPDVLTRALPSTSYSLVNLYIVAAPGLLLPLLWWFVAKPLGATSSTVNPALPLLATAALGAGLTAGVLAKWFDLSALGLRPDLATPALAAGFLIALICFAPARPLRRASLRRPGNLARVLLALLALGGLALLGWHVGTTLRWYDALVGGNRLVERALGPGGCSDQKGDCPLLDQAVEQYTQVICLRPGESEGYAFRGFANLARGNYDASRQDFERALGDRMPVEACPTPIRPNPSAAQRTSLYANIGAVETLLARRPPLAHAEIHYQAALLSYARALGLAAGDAPNCDTLAIGLLRPAGVDPARPAGANLLAARMSAIEADQAPIVLQLADACYSRGSEGIELINLAGRQARGLNIDSARQNAWIDLSAAIAEYRAVAAASSDPREQSLANHGLAATWLALSHIDRPPVGAPDRSTALIRAIETFQTLERAEPNDPSVFAGHAWTSLQINAWGSADAPLASARALSPSDPTYPALQGLVAWLKSTQYLAPRKGSPSPGYTTTISQALGLYGDVIALGGTDMSRAYATRSLLYYSLRNSPRDDRGAAADGPYQDEDYGAWMHLALNDADQALLEAQRAGLPPERLVGYRYWRARLSFALALTWQEKTRGPHDWSELVPLYSSAYQDYTEAAAADLNPERRKIFETTWIPWCRAVLTNATHMQLARDAIGHGDFARARGELALVDPNPTTVRKWDALSAPLPEYHYLHGLISLGLGSPADFPNPLIKPASIAPGISAAEASYTAAISATEDADVVPQPHDDYPDDARPAIYQGALADLDRLLAHPPIGWKPEARALAEHIRDRLRQRLAVLGH